MSDIVGGLGPYPWEPEAAAAPRGMRLPTPGQPAPLGQLSGPGRLPHASDIVIMALRAMWDAPPVFWLAVAGVGAWVLAPALIQFPASSGAPAPGQAAVMAPSPAPAAGTPLPAPRPWAPVYRPASTPAPSPYAQPEPEPQPAPGVGWGSGGSAPAPRPRYVFRRQYEPRPFAWHGYTPRRTWAAPIYGRPMIFAPGPRFFQAPSGFRGFAGGGFRGGGAWFHGGGRR